MNDSKSWRRSTTLDGSREVVKEFAGQHVFKANPKIVETTAGESGVCSAMAR